MTPEKDDPPLGETKGDVVARTLGTFAGGIPVIGQMIQIALSETIPNARLERIETYLRHLSKRTDKIELENALKTPEGLDLFEEGIWQAARALSEERKQRIAELVANGLKGELVSKGLGSSGTDQQHVRHCLRILNQLDDAQIIILASYQKQYRVLGSEEAKAFFEKHKDVLGPFSRTIGSPDLERASLKDSLERHLSSFGLLYVSSEDYQTGDVKYDLAPTGRNFLQFIGVADE